MPVPGSRKSDFTTGRYSLVGRIITVIAIVVFVAAMDDVATLIIESVWP